MTRAASTMTIADATASRRSRSTSKRRKDMPITSAGSATSPASHSRASLILIASVDSGGDPYRENGIAQPLGETCEQACESHKGLDHRTVEDAVKESTFE